MNLKPVGRWHGYDALRATMMILGVFFHAAYSYSEYFQGYVNDPASSGFFDGLLLTLHAFRMPVFFAMAGFFANMAMEKKGAEAWLRNRTRHILLPFLVGYFFMSPLITLTIGGLQGDLDRQGVMGVLSNVLLLKAPLYHFWFLYFLYAYCVLYVLALRFAPSGLKSADARLLDGVVRHATAPMRILLVGVAVTFLLMLKERTGYVPYSPWLKPVARVFLYYLFFFYAGTLMYRARAALPDTYAYWRSFLLFAVPVGALRLVLLSMVRVDGSTWLWTMANLYDASLCWLLFLGSTGFCLHLFSKEHPIIRRWADAGYWIYLVHFPIVMVMVALLKDVGMSIAWKYGIVVIVTLVVGKVSYRWFVKGKAIGKFLYGERKGLVRDRAINPAGAS